MGMLGRFFKSLKTVALTVRDALRVIYAPIISLFTSKDGHHIRVTDVSVYSHTEKQIISDNKQKKQYSRKFYLTDLDDTFIDWQVAKQNKAWKLKHRFIYRHKDEEVSLFNGAKEYIEYLNASNVRTAIVSNKSHDKLMAQFDHHKWGLLFDDAMGHDRSGAYRMLKPSYKLPRFIVDNFVDHAKFPQYAVERMLGDTLKENMDPVNVVFVGDRIDSDIGVANALDARLKKYNKNSSCVGILFNSRKYTNEQIQELVNKLPYKRMPIVVNNYEELRKVVDSELEIGTQKQAAERVLDVREAPAKELWVDKTRSEQSLSNNAVPFFGG